MLQDVLYVSKEGAANTGGMLAALDVAASVLATAFTMAAGWAAVRALSVAASAEQRAAEAAYYRALLGERAAAEIADFARRVGPWLEDRGRKVRALGREQQLAVIDNAIDDVKRQFENDYFNLRDGLTAGADSWGDQSLRNAIGDVLNQLEDEVTMALESSMARSGGPELIGVVMQRTSELTQLIRDHDPLILVHRRKGTLPRPKRLWHRRRS